MHDAAAVAEHDDLGRQHRQELVDVAAGAGGQEATRHRRRPRRVGRAAAGRGGDVLAGPVERLPAGGLGALERLGHGVVAVAEGVVQHEHGPLDRGQPFEQEEESHRERLVTLGQVGRVVGGGHGLGQPHARVLLPAQPARAEHVERPRAT